jgi:hypothetical protein
VPPPIIQLTRFVAGAALPGDFNADGSVDAADYVLWRTKLGTTYPLNSNGNDTGASAGIVDSADYDLWRANFGRTSITLSAMSPTVLEPCLVPQVLVIVVAFAFRRKPLMRM